MVGVLEKDKFLWVFAPFGKGPANSIRETLHCKSAVSLQAIVQSDSRALEWERDAHRRSVGEKMTEAMYLGWMPLKMEWWEGEFDDLDVLRRYYSPFTRLGDGMYNFYTTVDMIALDYPILKRLKPGVVDTSFMAYRPKGLRDV